MQGLLSAFDTDKVTFGLLEKRDDKPRNVVRLRWSGAKPSSESGVLLQTGRAVIDRGLKGDSTEVTVALEASQAQALRELESKALNYVETMQVDWFDKLDAEVLRERFQRGVNGDKLKLKLPADVMVFDTKRGDVGPPNYSEFATAGRPVAVLFEVPYIGFARTKYGLTYNARQLLLLDEPEQSKPGRSSFPDTEPQDDGIDADDALF